jgi:hypothetical protein
METRRTLPGWTADEDALLAWLRPQMTAERIAWIVAFDPFHAREDTAILGAIVATGRVPLPLGSPDEVLSMARFAHGDRVDHVARAFACTLLCLSALGDEDDVAADILPSLIDSALHLGEPAVERTIGLLVALGEGLLDHPRSSARTATTAASIRAPRRAGCSARPASPSATTCGAR